MRIYTVTILCNVCNSEVTELRADTSSKVDSAIRVMVGLGSLRSIAGVDFCKSCDPQHEKASKYK